MGRLYKRGKYWHMDLWAGGQHVRRSTRSTNKALALKIMQEVEVKLTLGKFDITQGNRRLTDFWKEFEDYSKTNHSPKTFVRYQAIITHFRDFLEKQGKIEYLMDLTPRIIERYKTYRKKTPTNPNGQKGRTKFTKIGAKETTINFELGTLRFIFNLAIQWGYLRTNPTKGVVRFKAMDRRAPRFLTREECQHLLAACDGDLRDIFYTFLNTGMRRGELENLEWSDIDFRRRRIVIQVKPFWKPKTGAREIPINYGLLDLLKKRKKARPRKAKSNFVFPSKSGMRTGLDLHMKIVETAKKAGIKDLTRIHDLRHTFASFLVMAGIDLPTVQKILGHSRIETTMIYAHLSDDHVDNAVLKIDIALPQM